MDLFDISDTPHSGRLSWFDADRFKHINPQLSMSVNSRTGKCDELSPFHHRATFAVNGQGSQIKCMGTTTTYSNKENAR